MGIPDSLATVANQLRAAGLGTGAVSVQTFKYVDRSSKRVTLLAVPLLDRHLCDEHGLIDPRQFYTDCVATGEAYVDRAYAAEIVMPAKPKPAIMAEIRCDDGELALVIADGAHRLYKAYLFGWKSYPARKVLEADAVKCLMPTDPAAVAELYRSLTP